MTNDKGISLIEVVIASTILLLVLLPVLSLFESCLHNYKSAGERTQLVGVGKGIMEEVIAMQDFGTIEYSERRHERMTGIKYDLSISQFQSLDQLRQITVTVYSEYNPENSIQFTTVRIKEND